MNHRARIGSVAAMLVLLASCHGRVADTPRADAGAYQAELTFEAEPEGYFRDIGAVRQLFADLHRIESVDSIEHVVHAGQKQGIVLRPTRPWETNNAYLYGTVLYDEEASIFRMWYQSWDPSLGWYRTLYASSLDGYRWDKPNLGLFDYGGARDNNIVLTQHSSTVVLGGHGGDERYRMVTAQFSGYHSWGSADGIKWHLLNEKPILPDSDVSNLSYDSIVGRYILTTKHPHPSGRRVAFLSTSQDYKSWSPAVPVMWGDAEDVAEARSRGFTAADIYGMPIVPYEDLFIGFPWVMYDGAPGQPVEVQIAFSRNLRDWDRRDRTPVIPRGRTGDFDSGMTFSASNLLVRGSEVWMYYGGWDGPHDADVSSRSAAIGLVKWRRDGFASMRNCCGGGVITTRRIVPGGRSMHVNANMDRGQLLVEVLDARGHVVPGFEASGSIAISTDSVDHRVSWASSRDFAELRQVDVRLRFYVDRGDVFSYWFSDD